MVEGEDPGRDDLASDKALPERPTEIFKRGGQETPEDAPSIPTVSAPADPPRQAAPQDDEGAQDEG
jgi:hypothetical protein